MAANYRRVEARIPRSIVGFLPLIEPLSKTRRSRGVPSARDVVYDATRVTAETSSNSSSAFAQCIVGRNARIDSSMPITRDRLYTVTSTFPEASTCLAGRECAEEWSIAEGYSHRRRGESWFRPRSTSSHGFAGCCSTSGLRVERRRCVRKQQALHRHEARPAAVAVECRPLTRTQHLAARPRELTMRYSPISRYLRGP